jgi:glycosyltransferase involved in cell wall biosynthesis
MAAKNQPYLRNTIRGLSESVQKIERKENELQLANHIIVASNFTKSTLIETPYYEKTIVIPYGFPQTVLAKKQHTIKKLKVLFVGGLTQRKGIGEVLDSMKSFQNQIELTIIGQLTEQTNLEFINKIKQHHWIKSLPHSEVLKVMDEHDILLFPSWFEGFGLVISEAMSRGLPVITTPNTGANEFIKNGINGWLINPGETDKIESILDDVLANRSKLIEMSEAAITTANKRPWSHYKSDLANFVIQQNV